MEQAAGAGAGGAAGAPEAAPQDAPPPPPPVADPAALEREAGAHGCQHYRRRCKLVAPCCGRAYWCRHCHNEREDEAEPDPAKRHTLDRRAVREVVCALCALRQPFAPSCAGCGAAFGRYHCHRCRFFDDDLTKGQWHCDACGLCRVGGEHNFFHCRTCDSCLSVALRDEHTCVADAMKRACPVCMEYLFDSVRPISVLPRCGHVLHTDCFSGVLEHSVACPLCMRCAVAPQQRDRLWRRLDEAVASTPMPAEYAGVRVPVLCNDCGARSTPQMHVIGHKCASCGGYNTRRV